MWLKRFKKLAHNGLWNLYAIADEWMGWTDQTLKTFTTTRASSVLIKEAYQPQIMQIYSRSIQNFHSNNFRQTLALSPFYSKTATQNHSDKMR